MPSRIAAAQRFISARPHVCAARSCCQRLHGHEKTLREPGHGQAIHRYAQPAGFALDHRRIGAGPVVPPVRNDQKAAAGIRLVRGEQGQTVQ